jgi:hypothetical protein
MTEVTQFLSVAANPKRGDELLSLVNEELRRLAAAKIALESTGQTLQPTALVHEAWPVIR